MKRITAAVFLTLALLMVLFFTLQEPEQSRDLSEAVKMWLEDIGITVEYKSLRSNAHILEYFIVGLAVCRFCRSRGWSVWIGAAIACGIGVADEGVKMLLPGREFCSEDLIRDFIGIVMATMTVKVVKIMKYRREAKKRRVTDNDGKTTY